MPWLKRVSIELSHGRRSRSIFLVAKARRARIASFAVAVKGGKKFNNVHLQHRATLYIEDIHTSVYRFMSENLPREYLHDRGIDDPQDDLRNLK